MAVLSLISAINADSVKLATDQGAVVTAQAALAAAQAVVANDTSAETDDDVALSAALKGLPGFFTLSADGLTATVYQWADGQPGFTITNFVLAS